MRKLATVAVAAALLAGACGGDSPATSSGGGGTVQSAGVVIPSQLVGLKVAPEDVSKQAAEIKQSYVDSVGMFSLREDDLLRATLQVSRLSRIARPQSEGFRRSIIELVGGSTPVEMKIDDTIVYSTSGNRQNIFMWFKDRGMFILSVHQDFDFPRTLLRKTVALEVA